MPWLFPQPRASVATAAVAATALNAAAVPGGNYTAYLPPLICPATHVSLAITKSRLGTAVAAALAATATATARNAVTVPGGNSSASPPLLSQTTPALPPHIPPLGASGGLAANGAKTTTATVAATVATRATTATAGVAPTATAAMAEDWSQVDQKLQEYLEEQGYRVSAAERASILVYLRTQIPYAVDLRYEGLNQQARSLVADYMGSGPAYGCSSEDLDPPPTEITGEEGGSQGGRAPMEVEEQQQREPQRRSTRQRPWVNRRGRNGRRADREGGLPTADRAEILASSPMSTSPAEPQQPALGPPSGQVGSSRRRQRAQQQQQQRQVQPFPSSPMSTSSAEQSQPPIRPSVPASRGRGDHSRRQRTVPQPSQPRQPPLQPLSSQMQTGEALHKTRYGRVVQTPTQWWRPQPHNQQPPDTSPDAGGGQQ
jgi:hypothetical protein